MASCGVDAPANKGKVHVHRVSSGATCHGCSEADDRVSVGSSWYSEASNTGSVLQHTFCPNPPPDPATANSIGGYRKHEYHQPPEVSYTPNETRTQGHIFDSLSAQCPSQYCLRLNTIQE